MLTVFGAIAMELHLPRKRFPTDALQGLSDDYTLNAGGRAGNQALAAVRSGAKVALVGKTGDDDYAKRILDKLRREGVITSGVGKSETFHTGLNVICHGEAGKFQVIKSPGANDETSADQVPEEILDRNSIVLVQNDLDPAVNLALLTKAKEQGARIIMHLSPTITVTKEILDKLNYMILNSRQAEEFAEKLKLPLQGNIDKIAQALAKFGNLTCIITKGEDGAVAYTKEGDGWRVPALKLEEFVDHSGAEDAYCGTFAACLHASIPLPGALKRAGIAASLTCQAQGGQSAFPYLAEINEHYEGLAEPEGI